MGTSLLLQGQSSLPYSNNVAVASGFSSWSVYASFAAPQAGVPVTVKFEQNTITMVGLVSQPFLVAGGTYEITNVFPAVTFVVSAVNCPGAAVACTATTSFPRPLPPGRYRIQTASDGFQEAILYLENNTQGGSVLLTSGWNGSLSAPVVGYSNVLVHDVRFGQNSWYIWSGSNYVQSWQLTASGFSVQQLSASLNGFKNPAMFPGATYSGKINAAFASCGSSPCVVMNPPDSDLAFSQPTTVGANQLWVNWNGTSTNNQPTLQLMQGTTEPDNLANGQILLDLDLQSNNPASNVWDQFNQLTCTGNITAADANGCSAVFNMGHLQNITNSAPYQEIDASENEASASGSGSPVSLRMVGVGAQNWISDGLGDSFTAQYTIDGYFRTPFLPFGTPVNNSLCGTGNGTQTTFSCTLLTTVQYSSVSVTAGGITGHDDNNGNILGVGLAASSVNYSTGAVVLTFSVAPANGTSIYISYNYGGTSSFKDAYGIVVDQPFTGTQDNAAIQIGSVVAGDPVNFEWENSGVEIWQFFVPNSWSSQSDDLYITGMNAPAGTPGLSGVSSSIYLSHGGAYGGTAEPAPLYLNSGGSASVMINAMPTLSNLEQPQPGTGGLAVSTGLQAGFVAPVAQSGIIRLPNNVSINFRNSGNSGDLSAVAINASNNLLLGGPGANTIVTQAPLALNFGANLPSGQQFLNNGTITGGGAISASQISITSLSPGSCLQSAAGGEISASPGPCLNSGANGISAGLVSLSGSQASHTFAVPYAVAPVCVVSPQGTTPSSPAPAFTVNATAAQITIYLATSANLTFSFVCSPSNN